MNTSSGTAKIFAALVAANEDLTNPVKSEEVQAGPKTFSFVPLPDLLDHVRPVLRHHGLALIQEARTVEGFAGVGTRLIHTSGEWIEYDPLFIPSAADAQSIGSVITYGCRYTLCAALGISGDKDDERELTKKKSDAGTGGKDAAAAAATATPVSDPTSEGGSDGSGTPSATAYGEGAESDPPSDLDTVIRVYGGTANAFAAAKELWPDTKSLAGLTDEDRAAMVELKQKMEESP